MFNTIRAFKKQFTRVEGGYLVYPSSKVGGKLITEVEYEQLVADWERTAGRAGLWKTVGAVATVAAVWVLLANWLSPPHWADTLIISLVVGVTSSRLLWASTAPGRLVKNRLPVAPPRSLAEAKREARAALNWPFVLFALLISGSAFVNSITATDWTASVWAWLIGSGAMFGLYIWIGLKKLLD